jgi:hypothetical protein
MGFAQATTKIHQQQCGREKNCRINILTSKQALQASCVGRLFDELQCEMEFKAGGESSDFTLLCKDGNLVPHLDATIPVDFYSYRVTKVHRTESKEKFNLDPSTYFAFEHPAFKANLSLMASKLKSEIVLVLNKTEYKMESVDCTISESAPSSDGPVQSVSQF